MNSHENAHARLASIFEGGNGRIIVVDLVSIPGYQTHQEFVICNTKLGPRWMNPIVEFLCYDKLLEDKKETHKL